MAKRSSVVRALTRVDIRALTAERAYYKAEQRGFSPGHDVDDWLAAEREIAAAAVDKAAAPKRSPARRKSAPVKKLPVKKLK